MLRADGTLWLNYGDCYATGAGKVSKHPGGGAQGERWRGNRGTTNQSGAQQRGGIGPLVQPNRMPQAGLKPKDLVLMPARIALALQSDGWWLRSEIVWAKPNPMPESVRDRPTSAHEKVFLLTKSARYFYDADAVREPGKGGPMLTNTPYQSGTGVWIQLALNKPYTLGDIVCRMVANSLALTPASFLIVWASAHASKRISA